MGFSVNPLSLSVPDSAFESWLQDSGFVDLLHHRTSAAKPATAVENVCCFASLLTQLVGVFSLLTINPFSKLEADDFAGDTLQWTTVFFGDCDSYSLPSSSQEARTRVHENTKRFARNYATLFIVFFTCALYQMPFALLGFVTSLVLWELFKFCSDRWEFHRHRLFRKMNKFRRKVQEEDDVAEQ